MDCKNIGNHCLIITRFIKGFQLVALALGKTLMLAPLTFVGEKNRKVTAVYPANDSQSCTCKLNLGSLQIAVYSINLMRFLSHPANLKIDFIQSAYY